MKFWTRFYKKFAVNTNSGVASLDLRSLNISNSFNGPETTVVGKDGGSLFEGISESSNGILFNTSDLRKILNNRKINLFYVISGVVNSDGASDFRGATSVDDSIAFNQVSDNTQGIVDGSLGFINDHDVTTSNKDGAGLRVFTLFDDQHLFVGGTEREFSDSLGFTELFGSDFSESGDDSATSGQSEEFNIDTTDPSNGIKLVLEQEMVGFIVKAPLAEDDISTTILDLLNHLGKIVLFGLVELLVILSTADVDVVLSLGLGGFEGRSNDADLGILNFLLHLTVTEVLVKNDTVNQAGIFKTTTSFTEDLMEKVNMRLIAGNRLP